MKPSVLAVYSAKKRSRAQGKPVSHDSKRATINMMDVLKALDKVSKRLAELEKEVHGQRNY